MDEPNSEPIDVDFDAAYRVGPPWDIGRPQSALTRLIDETGLEGPVLDVGCGTGDNALAIAALGLEVVGVDTSPLAIELANEKVSDGLDIRFLTWNAFELAKLEERFRTVVDCGLLHVIGDRGVYSEQLAHVTEPGGQVLLLEISDRADIPYPKISERQIRQTFPEPTWQMESLTETTFETHLGIFPAWLGVVACSHD